MLGNVNFVVKLMLSFRYEMLDMRYFFAIKLSTERIYVKDPTGFLNLSGLCRIANTEYFRGFGTGEYQFKN